MKATLIGLYEGDTICSKFNFIIKCKYICCIFQYRLTVEEPLWYFIKRVVRLELGLPSTPAHVLASKPPCLSCIFQYID